MTQQEILELQKKNCIFCKIIAKEIPSHEIYSDDKVLVILDINPANQGHCLILPKQHYQILPQIPPELIGYMFNIAKKTSRSLLKSLGIQGTTVFVANGALAGQKAPHFMIHVIPRQRGDMLFKIPKNSITHEEIDLIKQKLSLQPKQIPKPVPAEAPKQETVEERIEEKKQETVEKKEILPEEKQTNDEIKESNQEPVKKSNKNEVNIDDIANMFLN